MPPSTPLPAPVNGTEQRLDLILAEVRTLAAAVSALTARPTPPKKPTKRSASTLP